MKKEMLITAAALIACTIGVIIIVILAATGQYQAEQDLLAEQQELWEEINDNALPANWYEEDGYEDVVTWWNNISELKNNNINLISETMISLGEYLEESQITRLNEIEEAIVNSHSINEINLLLNEANQIIGIAEEKKILQEEAEKAQENIIDYNAISYDELDYNDNSYNNYSYSNGSSNNFKSQGEIYQDNYRYTWYSSNVAHHYRTDEWSADDDGIYRNEDGYVIVASDDDAYGSIVPTPFGDGIVQDSGSGSGTRDIYTNF